jgi:hypothetical protein
MARLDVGFESLNVEGLAEHSGKLEHERMRPGGTLRVRLEPVGSVPGSGHTSQEGSPPSIVRRDRLTDRSARLVPFLGAKGYSVVIRWRRGQRGATPALL